MANLSRVKDALQNKTLRAVLVFIFGIALLAVAFFTQGCASVSVNPETGEVHYYRVGNQTVQDVVIETPNGWKVEFSQDSKTEALKTALSIAEALK